MSFAVIKTGGKQYKVAEGDKLLIEKLDQPIGAEFDFEEVLLIGNGEAESANPVRNKPFQAAGATPSAERISNGVKIGSPLVEGAKVRARVLEHAKGDKKIVFKYTRKTRYKKKKGHRQPYTKVEILKIFA